MIHLTIDGKEVVAPEGTSIIRAARMVGIEIPHLCEFEHLTPHGGCRVCVVEIEGIPTLQTSCTHTVQEGMVVHTNTEKVQDARNFVLSLIFSERNHFCMVCPKSSSTCELQQAAYDIGMDHWSVTPSWEEHFIDTSHPWMIWNHNRCILCQRCVRACNELAGQHVIVPVQRGAELTLTTDYDLPWGESSCIKCGTCLQVCPTGAILEKKHAEFEHGVVLDGKPGICVECGVGCQTEVFTRENQLVRISGDWAGQINHGLLCEKGRFIAVHNVEQERITHPMIRMDGKLVEVEWYDAIMAMLQAFEGKKCGAMISARLPLDVLKHFAHLFHSLEFDLVTSSENRGDDYTELITKINDPKQAIVDPEMFGKRGKANSYAARRMGLTQPVTGDIEALFIMAGDDPDCDLTSKIGPNVEFLAVQSAYLNECLALADVILPAVTWLEEEGEFENLMGERYHKPAYLKPPMGVLNNIELLDMLVKEEYDLLQKEGRLIM